MCEVVPQGGVCAIGWAGSRSDGDYFENMPAERVEEMSAVMLANRKEVLQETQIREIAGCLPQC